MGSIKFLTTVSLILTNLCLFVGVRAHADIPPTPTHPAPEFTLTDVSGKQYSLKQFRGRPVVLYFFCGCEPCQQCARMWGRLQQSGVLTPEGAATSPNAPLTIVTFLGDARNARAFAAANALDKAQTLLLTDPRLIVARQYNAIRCPRVFVLDDRGTLRYTNKEAGVDSSKTPAEATTAQALTALRNLSSDTTSPSSATYRFPTKAAPALTVLLDNGMQRTGAKTVRYDVGTLDPLQTARLEHAFRLRNNTDKPIHISSVRTSCGCGSVTLVKEGVNAPQPTLAPGETLTANVNIYLKGLHSGQKSKYIWLYAEGATDPIVEIEIVLNMVDMVTFTPALIDFGKVAYGSPASLILTVLVDARLAKVKTFPLLSCSNANVVLRPETEPRRTERAGQSVLERRYRLSLGPGTPVGPVVGMLFFGAGVRATPNGAPVLTFGGQNQQDVLQSYFVTLTGEVTGTISAAPALAHFGFVPLGTESKVKITLYGDSSETLKDCKAACASPWIVLNWQDSDSTPVNSRPRRVLEAQLSANAPPGYLTTRILITTTKGETLILPVVANVAKKD